MRAERAARRAAGAQERRARRRAEASAVREQAERRRAYRPDLPVLPVPQVFPCPCGRTFLFGPGAAFHDCPTRDLVDRLGPDVDLVVS